MILIEMMNIIGPIVIPENLLFPWLLNFPYKYETGPIWVVKSIIFPIKMLSKVSHLFQTSVLEICFIGEGLQIIINAEDVEPCIHGTEGHWVVNCRSDGRLWHLIYILIAFNNCVFHNLKELRNIMSIAEKKIIKMEENENDEVPK